jgi:hypothetical protein
MIYGIAPGVSFTTSAVANTEIDALFIKPGTRTIWMTAAQIQGKGANLTSLSGILQRVKKWTTTAASGGTAVTPSPRDPGYQAAKATAGQATAGVTPGTGGPVLQLVFGCSASGPGAWSALNNPDVAPCLEGSANNSVDFFNIAGAVSLVFELSCDLME